MKLLMNNPRASIADIARDVGAQRDTVQYRIERLEKRGVIHKYHLIVEPQALGLGVFMLVLLKLAPISTGERGQLIEKLIQHKHVTHISRLVGPYDYALQMAAPDIVAFDAALDEIRAINPSAIADTLIANIIDGLKTDDFSGLV